MNNFYWDSFDCEIQSDELVSVYDEGLMEAWKEALAEDFED